MKIGMLTTYRSKNYGACLQAFALQRKLLSLGYDVELIQYENKTQGVYSPDTAVSYKESIVAYLIRRVRNLEIKIRKHEVKEADIKVRHQCFDKFVDKALIKSDKEYKSEHEFMLAKERSGYDGFICGSDQIWNPYIHNFDNVYYLNFDANVPKCAYAPSIANNKLTQIEIKRIADAIKGIDHIALREPLYLEELREFTQKEITTVIDPTFLLSPSEWLSLTELHKKLPENYILVYLLDYNDIPIGTYRVINDYAIRHKCKVILLPYRFSNISDKNNTFYWYDVAPDDFIHLIANARFVMTNSFHGTALSINLNKQFFVFIDDSKVMNSQSRITTMMDDFGLRDRIITNYTAYRRNIDAVIDYTRVNKIIEKHRKHGIQYLLDSFN